jgi:hypothetical protein
MRPRTLQFYSDLADNYVNGNISDFKKGLKRLTKKELFVFAIMFERCYFKDANTIIFKHLD